MSKLDWSQVTYEEGDEQGGKQGLAFRYAVSKNNREQAERANPMHCSSVCKKGVEHEAGKLVGLCSLHSARCICCCMRRLCRRATSV